MEEVEIFTMLCPEYGASCSGGCGNSIAGNSVIYRDPFAQWATSHPIGT